MRPSPHRLSWCSGVVGCVCGANIPKRDGRLTPVGGTGHHLAPRVKAIESKTATRRGGCPRNTTKTMERGDTITMRHAAVKRTNVATRRSLKRSNEIILAAIIYLTASCFAVIGTLSVVAAIWVLWGTLGVR